MEHLHNRKIYKSEMTPENLYLHECMPHAWLSAKTWGQSRQKRKCKKKN